MAAEALVAATKEKLGVKSDTFCTVIHDIVKLGKEEEAMVFSYE
jgi:hypothetical protein